MINNYSEIIKYDEGDEYFDDFLKKIHLMEVFKCLLEDYPDKKIFTAVVKYVLYSYSIESDMLSTSGLTWSKIAEKILTKVGLDVDEYHDALIGLENDNVRHAISKWLALQNDENWTNYCHYRDLRREMLSSSIGVIKKATTEIDYEQKMKNAVHAGELLEMMNESLQKFIQNHNKLKTSVTAFNNVGNMNKTTASVEDFLHNKHN